MSQEDQVKAQANDNGKEKDKKAIDYFVNGESQTTTERKVAVKSVLANAGFDPTSDWTLSRDKDGQEFTDQDEVVTIHKDERFTATFTGPTPTS